MMQVLLDGAQAWTPGGLWNDVVLKFDGNPDVMFGDINLSEGGPRCTQLTGDLQAGAGGWPTILYFNKKTGYKGSS